MTSNDNDSEIIDLSMSSPGPIEDSPVSGGHKRKVSDNATPGPSKDKRPRTSDPYSLVEVKGKKLLFHQEPYSRAIPRRRLIKLESWLLDAEEEGGKIETFPEEFYDVVVMAGHELASPTEGQFVKALRTEIAKDNDALTTELLSPLVSKLFTLKQYGFTAADFGIAASKLPGGLQIRCWEANDPEKYFPADRIADLKARRVVRERAREDCELMLFGKSDEEKSALLEGKVDGSSGPSHNRSRASREASAVTDSSRRSVSPSRKLKTKLSEAEKEKVREEKEKAKEEKEKAKEEKERAKEEKEKLKEQKEAEKEAKRLAKQAERDAKKQEQEEKKLAKEREENKKAEVKAKQAQIFGSFFKAKAPAAPSSPRKTEDHENDYRRAFKPAPLRANVEWAPLNRWSPLDSSGSADVSGWSAADFLNDHRRRNRIAAGSTRPALAKGLKTAPRHGTVADVWAAHQEAADPQAVLSQLTNNDRFPWKTLAFDQQVRPPYSGTFTKKSLVVGPRTPFGQDPIFDYSYDSGDEWQDDEGGDDVDDFGENEPEEALSDDGEEGEFDDWLDNEDDMLFQDDGDAPMLSPTKASPRKPGREKNKLRNLAAKRVTKLTPFWRGPVWEERIAEPVEGLEQYRIQLLNDTPVSIDPFKYVSPEPAARYRPAYSDTAVGVHIKVRCLLAAHEIQPTTEQPTKTPLGDGSTTTNILQPKARPAPKVAFPSSHVEELLRLVDGSPKILSDLISYLKTHFEDVTTKAAIDAKIREVATREGKGKDMRWRVTKEAWEAVGVSPPARGLLASFKK